MRALTIPEQLVLGQCLSLVFGPGSVTCDVLVGLGFWPFCDLGLERCTSMPCPATVSVFRYLIACVLKL